MRTHGGLIREIAESRDRPTVFRILSRIGLDA